jgi:lysophospholipase L1-like esterase
MKLANDLIRKLTEANDRLHFADVATAMLSDDGQPRPELYLADKLHLTPAGYELWTRILTPIVEPIIGK